MNFKTKAVKKAKPRGGVASAYERSELGTAVWETAVP